MKLALKEACGDKILKVIIETCYLTDSERWPSVNVSPMVGQTTFKTSTGFGSGGASIEDIRSIQETHRSLM